MSLLGTQVYGNPSTPCWLSSSGGVVNGPVTSTSGFIAPQSGGAAGFQFRDASGNEVFRLAALGPVSPQNIIQSSVPLVFTQIGQANGNTSLTTSTVGANTDAFLVGGSITATGNLNGIGPNPTQIITSTQTIATLSPTVQYFTQTTPYASVTGGEYDVMARGLVGLTSGTPAQYDLIQVTLQVGTTGNSAWVYNYFPADTLISSMPWAIRDRMPCDAGRAAIRIGIAVIPDTGSTAVYSATNTQFDVTRVL